MKNRFEALGDTDGPEEEHDMILATYRDAAKKVLGLSKKLSKPWIANKTWEKFKGEERGKIQISRSERLKQRWREEYNAKNIEVKRIAREDKRN